MESWNERNSQQRAVGAAEGMIMLWGIDVAKHTGCCDRKRRSKTSRLVWGFALMIALVGLQSRTRAADAPPLPVVTYNVGLSSFENALPHGVPFLIQFTQSGDNADYDSVTGRVWESGPPCATPSGPPLPGTVGDKDASGKRKYILSVRKLRFAKSYCFAFELSRKWSDADRAALDKTIREIIAAAVKRGSYDRDLISATAKQSLDKRAALPVVLVSAASTEKSKPLLDVVLESFTPGALKPLYDAGREHQTAIDNVRTETRKVLRVGVGLDRPAKLFGSPVPTDILDAEEAYAKTVQATRKAKRLSEDLPEAERQARLARPPAALSDDEQAYVDSLTLLKERMRPAFDHHCPEAGEGAERIAYCAKLKETMERVEGLLRNASIAQRELEVYREAESTLLDTLAKRVATIAIEIPPREVTTASPSYTERSAFYVSADVGGAVPIFGGGGGTDLAAFLGVSVSFTAVDKDIPLTEDDGFWKRVSLTTGWTLSDVQDAKGATKGILGGKGLMLGGGLRVTDYLRLAGGAMFVRQKDSNPVVADTHVRAVPYLSLSIDIDVVGTIRGSMSKYQGSGK